MFARTNIKKNSSTFQRTIVKQQSTRERGGTLVDRPAMFGLSTKGYNYMDIYVMYTYQDDIISLSISFSRKPSYRHLLESHAHVEQRANSTRTRRWPRRSTTE
jgi:hypothetical protein